MDYSGGEVGSFRVGRGEKSSGEKRRIKGYNMQEDKRGNI